MKKAALTLGPSIASFAGNFANPNTNPQNQGIQIYESFQQFTGSYPGLVPSMYQMFSTQINSYSVQGRYKAVQTNNVATGASTGSGGGGQSQNVSKGLDAMFVVGGEGLLGGLIMVILLVLKFMTCGPVCGAI